MKVLLISANTVLEPYPVYPLGLDYVAGAIAADHQVHLLDMNCRTLDASFEAEIAALDPEIIGISLRNIDNTDAAGPASFLAPYRQLMQSVRRITRAPIVLGGSGFTIFPQEIMALLQADYGIVGEGERLADLLACLAAGKKPDALAGLVRPGAPVAPPQPWQRPLERRFEPQAEHISFYLRQGGMFNLQTKRGCPFRCIYCSYPHLEGNRMRHAPAEEIARTAVQLEEAGAKYIFITDSAFNADIAQSLAVARAFKKAGLSIPWGGFFAPTRLPDGYFDTMAACGVKHVEFGTEALCDPVLAAYGKPFRRAEIFAAHRAALAAGLRVAHYFLFGGPGETEQTLDESLANIDRLEKAALFLFCGMRIYPHTGLHAIALQQGQITAAQPLTEPVFYQPQAVSLPDIARIVQERARGRDNWVLASGGEKMSKIMRRMYRRGFSGPLWEYLIH